MPKKLLCRVVLCSAAFLVVNQVEAVQAERPAPQAAVAFPTSPADYPLVKDQTFWTVDDVRLPDGRDVALELARFEVFGPGAVLVEATESGDRPLSRPDVALFRGIVGGQADSRVFLSVSPHSVYGMVEMQAERFIVSNGPHGQALASLLFNPDSGLINWAQFQCEVLTPPGGEVPPADGGVAGSAPCRVLDLAIETDYEFRQNLFGGDSNAANAYIATLLGAVTEIYQRDINLRYNIAFSRLWTTSSDPWTQTSTTNQLFQFRDYWNVNMTGQDRHLAHFLSGRALGGGVAYLDAVCEPGFDYGLSANLAGFFPYPIQNNHAQNWDLMVTAHELGHNTGAPHTHDHSPPIDNCAGGDCSVTPNGTIMSYCHQCPGGMTNVRMEFHPRSINEEMLPYLAVAACDLTVGGANITDQPDSVLLCGPGQVTFSVTANAPDPPIAYQWRRNGVELSNGGNISGATTDTLTIDPATGADAGAYDVVLTTSSCPGVTSNPATLTIGTPAPLPFDETWPSTTFDTTKWTNIIGSAAIDAAGPSEPSAPNSLHLEASEGVESTCMNLAGGAATLSYYWARSSTEAGDDLEVWYFNNAGSWVLLATQTAGSNSTAYTQATHNLPATALHDAFRVRFQASCSSTNDEWFVDNINVQSSCSAPSFTGHPSSQTACSGGSVTFNVTANGTAPLSYQWRRNGAAINGATSSSYGINPVNASHAGSYDCVVTNSCGSVDSNDATLTVNVGPSINTHPSSQTACEGGSVTFNVAANGTSPLSYQWRRNGAAINGATSSSYVINPVNAGHAGSYDCVVTNSCGSVDSNDATLTVNVGPSINTHPSSQTVNVGDPVTFNVAASGTGPLSYQWRKDGSDINGATGTSYAIAAAQPGDAGAYDVVVTNACGSVDSSDATLTVNAAPCDPCDTNCDGSINGFDIQSFVDSLSASPPEPCSPCSADTNDDGSINGFDIQGFVDCLNG